MPCPVEVVCFPKWQDYMFLTFLAMLAISGLGGLYVSISVVMWFSWSPSVISGWSGARAMTC